MMRRTADHDAQLGHAFPPVGFRLAFRHTNLLRALTNDPSARNPEPLHVNGQSGIKYDQDFRFGAGDLRQAFWPVDLLESAGYDGPKHFDFKPPRTEDFDGVWASAAPADRPRNGKAGRH